MVEALFLGDVWRRRRKAVRVDAADKDEAQARNKDIPTDAVVVEVVVEEVGAEVVIKDLDIVDLP
jgi:hypothetical protein